MSFSYDRYDSRRQNSRSTLGFWVPLVVTVTVAAGGLAAWVWSARTEDDDDDTDLSYGETTDERQHPPSYKTADGYSQSQGVTGEEENLMARMSGALRRTPSPQQAYDYTKAKVVAGVAAAGAVVGGALSSIREEDRDDYGDHQRWSEAAAIRRNVEAQSAQSSGAVAQNTDAFNTALKSGPTRSGKRKQVAVVLSAESALEHLHEESGDTRVEHASLLSSLTYSEYVELAILIFVPATKSRRSSMHGGTSLTSSYSAISTPGATPGEELTSLDPRPDMHTPGTTPGLTATHLESSAYKDIHSAALKLVEKPSAVMTFSTPTGHVHMLRHLGADLVYLTESLTGEDGENVKQLRNWVGQVVVVVGGAREGLGGLIDTEDESDHRTSKEGRPSKWWMNSDMVGLGKGVEIVDSARVDDDYNRRAIGRE